jgi:hypothetical protein
MPVKVTFVGFPLIDPTVALETGVPGMFLELPEESDQAFVESSKLSASNHIYGVSVTRFGSEAAYEVPAPSARVFQPAKEKPVFTSGTFGEAEDPLLGARKVVAAEETAVVGVGTEPLEFVFPSYVIVEVHFA